MSTTNCLFSGPATDRDDKASPANIDLLREGPGCPAGQNAQYRVTARATGQKNSISAGPRLLGDSHATPHYQINAKRRILRPARIRDSRHAPARHTALVNLASARWPTSSTTTSVLPNLLFILDTSGGMLEPQDYAGLHVRFRHPARALDTQRRLECPAAEQQNLPRDSSTGWHGEHGLTSLKTCILGDVPFMLSAMNAITTTRRSLPPRRES